MNHLPVSTDQLSGARLLAGHVETSLLAITAAPRASVSTLKRGPTGLAATDSNTRLAQPCSRNYLNSYQLAVKKNIYIGLPPTVQQLARLNSSQEFKGRWRKWCVWGSGGGGGRGTNNANVNK